ncbi:PLASMODESMATA CALLOSE-BINDING PROTEIN 5-like [Phalaenopsis equestris]|uniref:PLASMODESMATA CALLOSE-BINDING PROTEIN 5-like n=1 Tax=Phalaenopsis equestris TaxID=78828 RepID=UPI0009E456B0|nr:PLASMODESMATA CALLOSE-BINDING PROTEIN 5-like [Phalaenopsis equestris]
MTKLRLHLRQQSVLLLLLSLAFAAAVDRRISNHDGVAAVGDLWCVAKNNAEDAALQSALDWACGPGLSDCRPIQDGGICFEPDDLQSHASYAFNDYFRRHGSSPSACDFSGVAAITGLNPSLGDCKFPASSYASNGSFSGSSAGFGPMSADISSGVSRCRTLFVFVLATFFIALCVFR